MDPHSQTIQKLSEDISYLRGRFDTAIPLMEQSARDIQSILKSQDERLGKVEKKQENINTKVGVISASGAIVVSAVITWLSKKLF